MKKYKLYVLVGVIITLGCVEEIDVIIEDDFESSLVVEATITNQNKIQEVLLSRTYKLDQEGPVTESNANVKVLGNNGTEYSFEESEPGKYESVIQFAAQPEIEYSISITTQDGKMYGSNEMTLTHETPMDELFFERGFNENGIEGVSVFVNSYDPSASSEFYRFKFEETYKIVAPLWVTEDIVDYNALYIEENGVPPSEPIVPRFGLVERPNEELICYKTDVSNSIIIVNTNNLIEDRLDKFRVLFINRDNYIITHRYSILVTQYVQSIEAYTFYETLKSFSESESVFSETQPGFLAGNLYSRSNSQENVLGFFEVVAADTQRIYFNYNDLFSGETVPPYVVNCSVLYAPSDLPDESGKIPLALYLDEGIYKYFQPNEDPIDEEGPYDLELRPCGDCTVLGNSEPPSWWED